MTIDSPCINVCTLDESGAYCLGCFRTLSEIGEWTLLDDAGRAEVVAELPARREAHEAIHGKAK